MTWAPHLYEGGQHGNELDEDFFADEDELENDHAPAPKRSRKKFMIAALAGAMIVGGGGAYFYKSFKGGGDGRAQRPSFVPITGR